VHVGPALRNESGIAWSEALRVIWMIGNPAGPLDPATLAEEVRDLANAAHRVIHTPAPEVVEIDDLSRRIAHLQHQIRDYPFDELACWLENVRQIIETA
jgi:hypothetical protein